MKLTVMGIAMAAVLGGAGSTGYASTEGAGVNFEGKPIATRPVQLHVQGQPVQAQLITLELHEMDQRGSQPIGLWVYFYILPDDATGNAKLCDQWSQEVLADQATQSGAPTLSWLEIHVADGPDQITSDEGNSLIPDAAVTCWEARELKRAL